MLKKTRIAMLMAGALFAGHAGAEMTSIDDAMWVNGSASGSQQLTAYYPDGSWHSMSPVELQLTAVSDDSSTTESLVSAESLGSTHATVFNPDGTSYNIVASELQFDLLEPTLVVLTDDTLAEQVTVFEPSGNSYSYEFAPIELAMLEPVEFAMLEPIDVIVMEEDIAIHPIAAIDEDADSRPTYVAQFVSPPEYTGILEETLS